QSAGRLFQPQAIGNIRRHRLDLHADPAARDSALVAQLRDNALDGIGWNSESDTDRTAGRREDRGIDADDIAVDIESRATGIALVHWRVDLNEIVIRTCADIATARRYDTGRDGAAETKRITNRENPIADPRRSLREFHEREIVAIDLDQGEIGPRVALNHLCGISLAIIGGDLNFLGILHDVIICYGITVAGNEKARALAGDLFMASRCVRRAEALEETLER